jgi:NAD(P)-dependent dehydrogenase (short-subunit alcohol dehydrogenase family)
MKMKKTICITGASSGIGRVTAEYFHGKGWNVVATMRTPEKSTLTADERMLLVRLDVTDQASIDKALTQAKEKFGRVDVLVNNAGYGLTGVFESTKEQQIQKQFETNVFGLFRVVRTFLPLFRAQKSGTIINISSMGGRLTFPLYSLYHSTKWAVEGFTESLFFELKNFGIRVKLVEPGAIKTDFYDRSMDKPAEIEIKDYESYAVPVMKAMHDFGSNAPGPMVVAKTIYKAAVKKGNRLRFSVGSGAPFLLFIKRFLPLGFFRFLVKSQIGG